MIVGSPGGEPRPRYAQGLAVAVLIVVGFAVTQSALMDRVAPLPTPTAPIVQSNARVPLPATTPTAAPAVLTGPPPVHLGGANAGGP
jgi:hypothetical protein